MVYHILWLMGQSAITEIVNAVQMKEHTMTASADQHWVPDRNGLVQQGLIGDHMVRVTIAPLLGPSPPIYRVTIGLFHKYGNTKMNPRHREWTSRHRFSSAYKAWTYGECVARGATQEAQDRR